MDMACQKKDALLNAYIEATDRQAEAVSDYLGVKLKFEIRISSFPGK
jgi:hypothetical protein